MKSKPKNYLVYFQEEGRHQERQLFSYMVAYALAESTGGHVLIIIN